MEKQQYPEKLCACGRALLLVCLPVGGLPPEASVSASMGVNSIERSVGSGVNDNVYFDICVCVCINIC